MAKLPELNRQIVGSNVQELCNRCADMRDWLAGSEQAAQADWYIDPANSTGLASDANNGATATTPLASVEDFNRRMDSYGWVLAAYHIRILSDVPTTSTIRLIIHGESLARIFVHGSAIDGQGKTSLYTGTATTVTPLNYAAGGGGQSLDIIDAGVASWLTAGTGGTTLLNKRFRWTSGANIGGKVWAIADLGGAQPNAKARFNEPAVKLTYTTPFTFLTTSFVPANGETYVVEELVKIPKLYVENFSRGAVIIFESLDVGTGSFGLFTGPGSILFDGCLIGPLIGSPLPPILTTGCFWSSTPSVAYSFGISNSYSNVAGGSGGILFSALLPSTLTRWMSQGGATRLTTVSPAGANAWAVNQCGVFGAPNTYPIQVTGAISLAASTLWGTGSSNGLRAAILLTHGSHVRLNGDNSAIPASTFYMVGATSGAENGAFFALGLYNGAVRTVAPAYTVGTGVWTAERLLSAALMQTTVAGGGFGGYFFDPVTATSFGG